MFNEKETLADSHSKGGDVDYHSKEDIDGRLSDGFPNFKTSQSIILQTANDSNLSPPPQVLSAVQPFYNYMRILRAFHVTRMRGSGLG